MTVHNVHTPPSDCRTVLCQMASGERVEGFYGPETGNWNPRHVEHYWEHFPDGGKMLARKPFNPVGWCEIDEQEIK